jgi:hypothetical protein
MKTIIENTSLAQAIDRIEILLASGTNVLFHPAENIFVNAPVAIMQIGHQNELNGILLGIGLPGLRVIKLPVSKDQKKSILNAVKKLK